MNRLQSLMVALTVCVTSVANAALVLDFKPEPSNELPEIIFAGAGPAVPTLQEGPGAIASGDSGLPPDQQMPGGLTVEIPYVVPGIPGGTVNDAGTTTVRDVTLRLTGLSQSGSPVAAGDIMTQGVSSGTFQFIAGDGLGAPSVLLLQGNIGDATILRLNSGDAGSVLSSTVTYTGGLIPAIIGLTGDLSFSLINITDLAVVDPTGVGSFSADATGQLSVIPEPAAAALLGSAAAALLLRPRRRHRR